MELLTPFLQEALRPLLETYAVGAFAGLDACVAAKQAGRTDAHKQIPALALQQ